MKKIITLLLSLCLLSGCFFNSEPEVPFDTFIETTTAYFLEGSTSFNLNFLFNESEYDGKEFGLGFVSESEYLESMEGYEDLLKELESYNYKKLDSTQQIVYDALQDYLNRQLVMKDYYYYDNDYFGSYSSVVQELPLLLEMYTFNDVDDLENYLKNIQAFQNDFMQAVAFEKKRQELGLGYSKHILDETKTQIQDIIDSGGADIIETVNQIIDGLDFLSDHQKVEYKAKNKKAIQQDLMNAYSSLLEGLNTIEGKEENISIQDEDYYEAVIYNQLGIKTKISDIEDDLYDTFEESYDELYSLIMMDRSILDAENIYDVPYSEFSSAKEGLDYLKGKITSIVPEIADLSYTIYTVPESLQEGFAPAAYLTPKVDMTEDQSECIMINPSTSQDNLFPTLVHEGYPGHMYQNTYLRLKEYPTIMYLMDCIGYSEGWAIYMENRASEFLENNVTWQKLLLANDRITSCLLAIIDINIHYNGWDYNECIDFFNEQTGSNYTTELEDLYDIILQTPGYYLYYIYAGELMHDFYEEAKDELGTSFDEIAFHQVILDSGQVGLEVVQKNVQEYIKAND